MFVLWCQTSVGPLVNPDNLALYNSNEELHESVKILLYDRKSPGLNVLLDHVRKYFKEAEKLMLVMVARLLNHFKMIDDQFFKKLVERLASILLGTSEVKKQSEITAQMADIILLFHLVEEDKLCMLRRFESGISSGSKFKLYKKKVRIGDVGSDSLSRIGSSSSKYNISLGSVLQKDERNWKMEIQGLINKYEQGDISALTEGEKESEEIFSEIYFLLKGFYGKEMENNKLNTLVSKVASDCLMAENQEVEKECYNEGMPGRVDYDDVVQKIISLTKLTGQTKELLILLKRLHGARLPYFNLNSSAVDVHSSLMTEVKEKKKYNLNKTLTMVKEETIVTQNIEVRRISTSTLKDLTLKGSTIRNSYASTEQIVRERKESVMKSVSEFSTGSRFKLI